MNFSKRSRYGIRALIDLAEHTDSPCALCEIAERNNISIKYLEQIFSVLKKASIIKSIKGPQGGYFLAGNPEYIRISDIIVTLDGSYFLDDERLAPGQKGEAEALAVQETVIDPINEEVHRILDQLTLKKLTEHAEQTNQAAQSMYYI